MKLLVGTVVNVHGKNDKGSPPHSGFIAKVSRGGLVSVLVNWGKDNQYVVADARISEGNGSDGTAENPVVCLPACVQKEVSKKGKK